MEQGVEEVPEKYRRITTTEQLAAGLSAIERPPSEKSIPVIDLGGWEESRMAEVVGQVKAACEEWGFFRIVNHGVSLELMERMMRVCKEFIALPVEEKAAYVGRPGLISQGYGSKYTIKEDKVRDWRDYLYLLLQPVSVRDYDFWPKKPASFRETMDEYSAELKALALRLLGVISVGLGQRASLIEDALGVEVYQKMLINFYPRCPQPELTHGFHQHSDIGALTLVMQEDDAPVGLEVRHQDDWVPAHPIKGSFVVNVADQVEILTNGRYKSIEHRVIPNRHKSRLSVAMFCDAAPSTLISPAKELTKGPVYRPVKFNDHEVTFYDYGAKGKSIVQSYIISNDGMMV